VTISLINLTALLAIHNCSFNRLVAFTECGVNCHKKCEKFIPNLCGVNQKLLAEHLKEVKERSSSKDVKTQKSEVSSLKMFLCW
jgi:hypothetical protein